MILCPSLAQFCILNPLIIIFECLFRSQISKDDNMCCEAAFALQMIATRALGCQALIDSGALEQLAVLLGVSNKNFGYMNCLHNQQMLQTDYECVDTYFDKLYRAIAHASGKLLTRLLLKEVIAMSCEAGYKDLLFLKQATFNTMSWD